VTVLIGEPLTLGDVVAVATGDEDVALAPSVERRVIASRRVVEDAVESGRTIYGVTTGFGGLANVRIAPRQATRLQRDIVLSHATAVGAPLPTEVVRAMLLLKARTFAFGISGVRLDLLERLVRMLEEGVHPVVPAQGSLGASGDLALLAHLALPLLGEGEVDVAGERMPARAGLRRAGIEPLEPSYKEGLALVNGTEGMLALGILTLARTETLTRAADVTAAMTAEACLGTDRAFDADLIALRKHPGAPAVAANMRRLLEGSEIVASHRHSDHLVQDAYSLRCVPQVHGAYRDGLRYARTTLEAELASAVDNPTVLARRGEVVSGGNFHGEALGLALDHVCLCVTGYATIAERRIARLVDPELNNGLPPFLTRDPGRRSGFMLAHYTAASLTSESRGLCWPASSDSIPTSAGQEDHVSMGATSARRAAAVVANAQRVIAIEALAGAQALELRAPLQPAAGTGAAIAAIRTVSPPLEEDRPLAPDIEAARREVVETNGIVEAVERVTGALD
jgi:histidine ammonia-lyase